VVTTKDTGSRFFYTELSLLPPEAPHFGLSRTKEGLDRLGSSLASLQSQTANLTAAIGAVGAFLLALVSFRGQLGELFRPSVRPDN
jgi:hypothetical protein